MFYLDKFHILRTTVMNFNPILASILEISLQEENHISENKFWIDREKNRNHPEKQVNSEIEMLSRMR